MMKEMKSMFSLFIYLTIILGSAGIFAQNLPSFHIVDNESIGLTPTVYEKFGVAVADFDRNGYPDICCTRWQGDGYSRIFLNNGGIFQDITDQTPIEQIESTQEGRRTYTVLWVDYDNDGDKDLSFSTKTTFHLLRNDNNIFTDVAEELGMVSYKPSGFIVDWDVVPGAWADYDLDGDLDLVANQDSNPNSYLFRNDEGQFVNAATEAGLDDTKLSKSWGLNFEDIDLDGDSDLFSKNIFYFNDNGVFMDVTETLSIDNSVETNYREFFDYDNDGDLDLFKISGQTSDNPTIELWENRDLVFVNVSEDVALSEFYNPTRSMSVGDFDNDGDQDIFVHNNFMLGYIDILLLNEEIEPGIRVFADVGGLVGFTFDGDRKGSAFMDYNMDGFLDIYTASAEKNHILYHNEGNENNWIGFILEGTESNRDAVGSLVTLHINDQIQIRTKKCGSHFTNQDNPYIHFGIGQATEIDSVVIRWPITDPQVMTNLSINQYHNIKESRVSAVHSNKKLSKPASFSLYQNYPNPFNPETRINFTASKKCFVNLEIYNLLGRKIISLTNEFFDIGNHSVLWNGKDEYGNLVPGGIYVYQLRSGGNIQNKKMVFVQ